MPRPQASPLKDGIFSIPLLAQVMNMSRPTVRKLVDKGLFPGSFLVPGTKERRIPSPSVRKFLSTRGIPEPLELQTYINAYVAAFGTQTNNTN